MNDVYLHPADFLIHGTHVLQHFMLSAEVLGLHRVLGGAKQHVFTPGIDDVPGTMAKEDRIARAVELFQAAFFTSHNEQTAYHRFVGDEAGAIDVLIGRLMHLRRSHVLCSERAQTEGESQERQKDTNGLHASKCSKSASH